MKKIVVTNVFGPLNLGDFELFSKLIQLIDKERFCVSAIARDPELSHDRFPDIEFYEQLGKSNSLILRFIYLLTSFFYIISPNLSKKILPSGQTKALDALRESDLAIACPGGFLEDSSFSFYTHLVQVFLATKLSKKVVMSPMSIGPARGRINKLLLKLVLKRVDKIYVRESVSAELCSLLSLPYTISNDLAFEFKHDSIQSKKEKIALFTIIDWNFPGVENKDKQWEMYISALVESAEYLYLKYGFNIGVIQQVASDRPAINEFTKLLQEKNIKVNIFGENWSPKDIMALISTVEVVIASRFHSAIFSLNVGTPVVPISYLPKTSGMLDLYGASDLYLDIVDLTSKDIISKLDGILLNKCVYQSTLKEISRNLIKYRRFENEDFSSWS